MLSARNYFSTLAYQGKGEGLDEDLIIETTALYTSERYMLPDAMLILTLDDEAERAKRISGRGVLETPDTFESKDTEFQSRVNTAYIELAKEHHVRTVSCIDPETGHKKSIEEIQAEIRQIIEPNL